MSNSRERYLELIHAEMDGETTEKELATLRELASDPEAQKVRAELAKLANVLAQVEEVETPGDLHTNILAALPPRRPCLQTASQNSSPWRLRIPFVRYGYALAFGLLLGAALTGVALRNLSPQEKSDIYGSLAVRENASRYVAVERMNLDSPDLGGSVELSRSGANSMIVFDLHGQQAKVEVGFDDSQAGLMSFNQQPGAIRSLEARAGIISFQSEGKQRSTVILTGEKDAAQVILHFRFYVGDKLIHQGTLGGRVPAGSLK